MTLGGTKSRALLVGVTLVAGLLGLPGRAMAAGSTTRESVNTGPRHANGDSFDPVLSDDGAWVAFTSIARNIAGPDAAFYEDVFVRARSGTETVRVSVTEAGGEPNGWSDQPAISASGRFVAFRSSASDLVAGDGNGTPDIFVRDRDVDADGVFDEEGDSLTERVSVGTGGIEIAADVGQPSISDDGRYVAFTSTDSTELDLDDVNGYRDVFVHDRTLDETSVVSWGPAAVASNGDNYSPAISGDGYFVAFESSADNLLPTADTNSSDDIFVRNLFLDVTELVSVPDAGGEADNHSSDPSISDDGMVVAFVSAASNLVGSDDTNGADDVFAHNRSEVSTQRVSLDVEDNELDEASYAPAVSGNGTIVAFSTAAALGSWDTNGETDIYAHSISGPFLNWWLGSPGDRGVQPQMGAALSDSGRFVAYSAKLEEHEGEMMGSSCESNVYLADLFTIDSEDQPAREWISQGSDEVTEDSWEAVLSAGGRYVAFASYASNIVPGDDNCSTDVFVRDRQTGATERITVPHTGTAWGGGGEQPSITPDGRFVAFSSWSDDLVADDENFLPDVFVWDRVAQTTTIVSVDSDGSQGNGTSDSPSISADGRVIAFLSDAGFGTSAAGAQVFVRDTAAGLTTLVSETYLGAPTDWPVEAPRVSADGTHVAFAGNDDDLTADANGYYQVFVRDLGSQTTEIASYTTDGTVAADQSHDPAISADGRYVAFTEYGVLHDVYVRDRQQGTTKRVSVTSSGDEADGPSVRPSISADGRRIAFQSHAANLVPNDANFVKDIFVRDETAGSTTRVSVDGAGNEADGESYFAAISPDGGSVAFMTYASNLAGSDTNGMADVYVHDRDPLGGEPDLSVTTSADKAAAAPGEAITYTSIVTNIGVAPVLIDTLFTAHIPHDTTLGDAPECPSGTPRTADGGICLRRSDVSMPGIGDKAPDLHQIVLELGPLGVGESREVVYAVTVDGAPTSTAIHNHTHVDALLQDSDTSDDVAVDVLPPSPSGAGSPGGGGANLDDPAHCGYTIDVRQAGVGVQREPQGERPRVSGPVHETVEPLDPTGPERPDGTGNKVTHDANCSVVVTAGH